MRTFAEPAFIRAVRALQELDGSRASHARLQSETGPGEGVCAREVEHIANADSLYMATVIETGWPYVQHHSGWRQRTEKCPEPVSPGQWRPSQVGQNPCQHWGAGEKTNRERLVF